MKKTLLLLSLLPLGLLAQDTLSALFLGNSYTYGNNLPGLISSLADSGDNYFIHDQNTPGGHQLIQHCSNSTSINKIYAQSWDFVVIQEQSQKPSFPPAQVESDVYPYAHFLDSMIVDNDSCTETVFFMTWGRKNGDQSNCANYPPLCTYEGMQERLRDSYLEMTYDNNAICSPVGSAWWATRIANPTLNLYNADESHPNMNGSYLAACVFYATLFRESPMGNTFYAGLNSIDAQFLQQMAHNTVFDSLETWRIGNYDLEVGFSYTSNLGLDFSFQNESANSGNCYWDFGDGNISTDENPSHSYTLPGTYEVMLICNNGCALDTLIQTVQASTVGLTEEKTPLDLVYLPYHHELKLNINGYKQALLFDMSGKLIAEKKGYNSLIFNTSGLTPGAYILKVDQQTIKFFLAQ